MQQFRLGLRIGRALAKCGKKMENYGDVMQGFGFGWGSLGKG